MAGCKAYGTRARRKGGQNRPVTLELKLIYIRFFPPIDPQNNIHAKLVGLNESNCSKSPDFIEELFRMKMGLLVFMRNVLLALCLFLVLGFLYYSAWKLHLLRWEDSKYDKLGFLLKLDSKLLGKFLQGDWSTFQSAKEQIECRLALLKGKKEGMRSRPPELVSKYSNMSEGVCKPGYASALMTAIFPKFSKPAPMFLDDSFRKWAKIRDFLPPFGIKGQDNLIKAILSVTKNYHLTPTLDSLSCKRCIIVGNGGILANKSLGLKIDDYDIVIRLNSAPVKGFEKDVGGKTTMRITYPEGAIQKPEQYEKDSLFVLAGFKWQDFKWLKYIVYKEKVSASDGFWKSVATHVPREPHEIRILNPYFIQEAAFSFIGLPFNNGLMGRGNIPTLGSVAITMVLHNCDEVAVAGFGYDMNSPNAPLHYYENIKMSAIKESWTHNIQREKEFLRKLVKARVITDLTSGI